jgi:alkylmercury lyase
MVPQVRLSGLGLSLSPTPHQLHLGEQRFYTWCALDALTIPVLLGRDGTIVSSCPATGKAIHLHVSPERLLDLNPTGTVMSVVIPGDEASARAAACDPQDACCNHRHFFASYEAAARWPSLHPEAVLLEAEEAAELGRELARHFLAIEQEPDEYHQYSI